MEGHEPADPSARPRLSGLRLGALAVALALASWRFPLATLQILGLVAVVVAHEAAHLVAARRCGMWAKSFSVGFGPKLLTIPGRAGTDYHLKLFLVGGSVDIPGMSTGDEVEPEREAQTFRAASWARRAFVAGVGPVANLVLPVVLLFVLFTVLGVPSAPKVKEVSSASGLAVGDLVVKIDKKQVTTAAQAATALKAPGTKLVAVERADGGSTATVSVAEGDVVVFPPERRLGVAKGMQAATTATAVVAWKTVGLVPQLVSSPFRALVDPGARQDRAVSPIGLGRQAETLLVGGGVELWVLVLASISILLGVVNLMPVLPLDGGRLVLALAEGVLGRLRGAPVHLDGRFTLAVTACTLGVVVVGSVITVLLDVVGA